MKTCKSEKRLLSKFERVPMIYQPSALNSPNLPSFYLSHDSLSRTRHTQNEHRSFQVSASFFPERNFYSLGAIRPIWTPIPKEIQPFNWIIGECVKSKETFNFQSLTARNQRFLKWGNTPSGVHITGRGRHLIKIIESMDQWIGRI